MLTTKEIALNLIIPHEGLYSASPTGLVRVKDKKTPIYPYRDPSGVWTIGFGTTIYPDGKPVRKTDPPITYEKAVEFMLLHIDNDLKNLKKYLPQRLTRYQVASLLSLSYNIGWPRLARTKATKGLLHVINENPDDFNRIEPLFKQYQFANGRRLSGLIKRRNDEFKTYKKKVSSSCLTKSKIS
ncbi:lysozyme [Flavobacterium fontis]|uniref:Lysozyme n=1 Tax=Flavobacterium fontis TaxID=1124188 RepID=A0A1M4Z7Q5_9FLAO|nr:lysozyme [Flavobacterium fontis]SHF14099.1 lysozyme [Flavobacterium fontis]SHF14448.1 lysozyme [Flavobacterium fontis]